MTFSTILIMIALISSVILALDSGTRLPPALAIAVTVLELLNRFNVLKATIFGYEWMLILGAALVVIGAVVWVRVSTKLTVTSATLLVAVGALQVISRIPSWG
jgi:hypothetical protein